MNQKEMRLKLLKLDAYYTKHGYSEKLEEVRRIVKKETPKLPYHNYRHALKIQEMARFYGLNENVSAENMFVLETACLLHDVVYVVGNKDNEEKSVKVAEKILSKQGYSKKQIKLVSSIILATKLPTKPRGILQKIICDCDCGVVGTKEFAASSEKLRKEFDINRQKWYEEVEPAYLKEQKYYTRTAKLLRKRIKQKPSN